LGETKSSQIAFVDALPKSVAEILLQHPKFHRWEYSMHAIAMG